MALPTPTSSAVVVLDVGASTPIYEKHSNEQRSIASITKLMTALVVVDASQDLAELITVNSADVVATQLRGKATSSSLPVGTTLTRLQLLQLMLMNSQNRAAAALARSYPGGITAFVAQMNAKAGQLGLINTRFTDPTGLHSTNVSTASEVAKLISTVLAYPLIQQLSITPSFSVQVRKRLITFRTTNRLTHMIGWSLLAQKTGYITAAGRCMAIVVQLSNNRHVVIVVLNAQSTIARLKDVSAIKSWLEALPPPEQVAPEQ